MLQLPIPKRNSTAIYRAIDAHAPAVLPGYLSKLSSQAHASWLPEISLYVTLHMWPATIASRIYGIIVGRV